MKTIEEAFSEIGELEEIRLNPQESSAIVTFKDIKCSKEALARDGATIVGQIVRIRAMSKDDAQLNYQKDRIQGGTIEVSEFEKRAFAILSYPSGTREEKLRDQLSLLTKQEKDTFIEVYRSCESIVLIRQKFDAAIEAADNSDYVVLMALLIITVRVGVIRISIEVVLVTVEANPAIIGVILVAIEVTVTVTTIGSPFFISICLNQTYETQSPLCQTPMPSDKREKVPLVQRMFSSGTSALITKTIVTPFDVIKTYLQAEFTIRERRGIIDVVSIVGNNFQEQCKKMQGVPKLFRRTFAATKNIWLDGGFRAFYSGLVPTLMIAIPNSVLYYSSYDGIKWRLEPYFKSKYVAWMVPAISGGLSRTLAVVCVEPLEFLKTQAQARMPGGFIGAIRRVGGEAKVHGVLYLWKGVYTNLLRDISFSALHWLMSLSDKSVRSVVKRFDIPRPAKSFLCGATAGALASFLVNPFDVVKTQQQVRSGKALPSFGIMRSVYQEDGIGGLFKGVGPRVVKSAVACALMITFYEYGKELTMRTTKKE
ncbi:solute carrier family [Blastocystis sp. subtype 4]|uniref:solute carrier family n=1 Tax=Blastocystis sp. subtype 4 TaxID=944170 RepID=UPI00071183D3|nr:solute carrier family [Blastocystis sp. subtype 4]KNB43510.1 solute carrier family [Blastocystis sp. subtype 4]|eukprot:XP_014526953.1 solute carrier family [Blastocystis sp. subtype 4]